MHVLLSTSNLVANVRAKLTIARNDFVYALSGLHIYVSEKPNRMTNLPCILYGQSLGGRSEKYMKMYIRRARKSAVYIYVSVRLQAREACSWFQILAGSVQFYDEGQTKEIGLGLATSVLLHRRRPLLHNCSINRFLRSANTRGRWRFWLVRKKVWQKFWARTSINAQKLPMQACDYVQYTTS